MGSTYGPSSFTITGVSLTTANVTVASLSGYTFSTTSGGTYTSSLSLPQPGGAYSQAIFVKFSPNSAISYNGNIVVGGGGASAINVAVSGTGSGGTVSITNHPANTITTTSALAGGNTISSTCGASITDKGVVWNTAGSPTLADNSVSSGSGTVTYTTSAITGLTANTRYYYSAYATNSNGSTGYGASDQFTTISNPPTAATANTATSAGFTASWTAPTGNGAGVPFGYQVKVYTDASFTTLVQTNNYITDTFLVVTGLNPSTQYFYTVSFENSAGYSATANYSSGITTLSGPCFDEAAVNTSSFTRGGSTTVASSSTALRLASGSNPGSITT